MYESAAVIIRLDNVEIQEALAIWLDNDAQQALRFIKEKIVNKTVRAAGKHSAAVKTAPCHLVTYSCACCRARGVGSGSPTGGASLRQC
jgi:hypothetical protein